MLIIKEEKLDVYFYNMQWGQITTIWILVGFYFVYQQRNVKLLHSQLICRPK